MKRLYFLTSLVVLLLCISCSKDEDGEKIDSNLVGNWIGTYSGDDRGVWTVNVSSNGKVSGTATSTFTSDSAEIRGEVSGNGALSATLGNSEDRSFVGQLREDNDATGTWIDERRDQNGTWTGSKQ